MADKKVDLAGPGIGDYDELERILPKDYKCLLTPKETQKAIFDGFVKSPTSVLRCILRHCGVP